MLFLGSDTFRKEFVSSKTSIFITYLFVVQIQQIYFDIIDHGIIHTYHSRFIPERVAVTSRVFFPDAHVLPKLHSYEEYCRRD
jgi:hypothetical protein